MPRKPISVAMFETASAATASPWVVTVSQMWISSGYSGKNATRGPAA